MPQLVTVGLDGSPESEAAARWGAEEALRRGWPLRLLNAWGVTTAMEPIAGEPGEQRRHSEQLLQEAEAVLRLRYPELEVDTESVTDGPVHALLAVAVRSAVLVLGTRGLGALAGFLMGSVSQQVVARATCPVVMIRTGLDVDGPDQRDVVLGVKRPSDMDRDVVGYAFSAAAVRGVPLRAVHVWKPPAVPGGYPPVPSIDIELASAEEEALTSALDTWRVAYPDVTVHEQSVVGSRSQTLIEAAASGAGLAVVGRGGRRLSGLGLRIGPVVHALLHHASCPVAVVPHA